MGIFCELWWGGWLGDALACVFASKVVQVLSLRPGNEGGTYSRGRC